MGIRLEFLKHISGSNFTLPIVSIIVVLMWLLLRPDGVQWMPLLGGLGMTVISVYALAELNNRQSLLRISSRLISSMYALLMGIAVTCHGFDMSQVVALLVILSFFPLFSAYHTSSQTHVFVSFVLLSLSTFIMPGIMVLVPFYWLCFAWVRSLTFRCFIASLLGLIVPYWIYGGVLILLDDYAGLWALAGQYAQLPWLRFSDVSVYDLALMLFSVVILMVGYADLKMRSYLDKTRTRVLFSAVTVHSVGMLAMMLLLAPLIHQALPILMVNTAIIGGHFFALNYSRLAHIIAIVVLVAALGIIILQSFF